MVEELERLCSDYKQSQVELGISEEITGTEVYANGNSTDDDDDDIRVRQIIGTVFSSISIYTCLT